MKKYLVIGLIAIIFAGCAVPTTTDSFFQEKNYGEHCPNPKFVASVYLNGINMKLYQCLQVAKEKYGDDVSINNVHWDIGKGIKRGVIFDVVKCK